MKHSYFSLTFQVLFQVNSAAQRFLEQELATAHDMKTIVPIATAVLVSHSSIWPETMAKLDSVYDQLLDCYFNDRQGIFAEFVLFCYKVVYIWRNFAECLNEMTYALTAYSHQNKPAKVLDMVRNLVAAPWQTLHPLVKNKRRKVHLETLKQQSINRNVSFFFFFQEQTEDDESLE